MCHLTEKINRNNIFFLVNTDDSDNTIFKNRNIIFTNNKNEQSNFESLIESKKIKYIVLDMLHYKDKYIANLKNKFNKTIISFHEYEDYSSYSDLSFNCNMFDWKNYKHIKNLHQGEKYIIFNDKIEAFKNQKKKDYIFVNFGGSDPSNFTLKFIKLIIKNLPDQKFIIHLSSFYFFNLSKDKLPKNIKINTDGDLIFKLLSNSKLAILAAGNMMYESIYLKTPTFVLAHNKHQENFARYMEKKKLIQFFGTGKNMNFKKLLLSIKYFKDQILDENNLFIDNNGKKRILNVIRRI
tara:strand:+ start:1009 stop:1893 length:885 start_codon:yes stop_codon:yes gene_type:complete